MAFTTTTSRRPVRDPIDRMAVRRTARQLALQALESSNHAVRAKGQQLVDYLDDEAYAQENALAANSLDFDFWADMQAEEIRLVRATAASLEGILGWRVA